MECFNLLELFDYLQNTTPSHQHARIKAHLVECLDCHKSLRWLKLVQTAAAEDHSFDFPEEVIAAIVARFKEMTATDRRTIRQYIAESTFDSGGLWRNPMACPSLTKLILFLQNREAGGERKEIFDHLSTGCPHCLKALPWVKMVLTAIAEDQSFKLSVENLRWLEKFLTTAAEDQSFEFPEETIAAIVAKFKEQIVTSLRPIRQYMAKLIYITEPAPEPGYGRLTTERFVVRRALYRAEGYDIDLKFILSYQGNNEQLIGRIRPQRRDATRGAYFKIELLQDGLVVYATNTNRRRAFKFEKLLSGAYDMRVSVPDGEIYLEGVLIARA